MSTEGPSSIAHAKNAHMSLAEDEMDLAEVSDNDMDLAEDSSDDDLAEAEDSDDFEDLAEEDSDFNGLAENMNAADSDDQALAETEFFRSFSKLGRGLFKRGRRGRRGRRGGRRSRRGGRRSRRGRSRRGRSRRGRRGGRRGGFNWGRAFRFGRNVYNRFSNRGGEEQPQEEEE